MAKKYQYYMVNRRKDCMALAISLHGKTRGPSGQNQLRGNPSQITSSLSSLASSSPLLASHIPLMSSLRASRASFTSSSRACCDPTRRTSTSMSASLALASEAF